jgi:hypothetical protein
MPDDKCVKIVEQQGDDIQVTRDCLSNLVGQRLDIPADTEEGCRRSAQPNTAVYVQNQVRQLNLRRDHYKQVEFCICDLDEWCNSATALSFSLRQAAIGFTLLVFGWWTLAM